MTFFGDPSTYWIDQKAVLCLAVIYSAHNPGITVADLHIALLERSATLVPIGTLYPIVDELVAKKLVTATKAPGPKGRPRAHYMLSSAGEEVLQASFAIASAIWRQGAGAVAHSEKDRVREGVAAN